ncbi:MAG: type IV secretory system conjugative DNA transfer family protein [Pseudomonadota bacterium]
MPHPFGNDTYRFGSAAFAEPKEIKAAGFYRKTPTALYIGHHNGRPLYWDGMGGVLMTAGARSGKLRDILADNVCSGTCQELTLIILDPKGELAAISQDQTPDDKYCLYWNPSSLHGLPEHRINPVGHLRWSSPTLVSDTKLLMDRLLPKSGSANARYFELSARRVGEALALSRAEINGELTLPDLYDAILALQSGGAAWDAVAEEMRDSSVPECRAVEAEIAYAQQDSSGGWRGIQGELMAAVACLSDPELRASVSAPFDAKLEDLLSAARFYQFYLMCPVDMIEGWAPVLKAFLTGLKTLKLRRPDAPRQTWIIDEAARLKGYEEIPALFTDGAGIGIRPLVVLQDISQANDLGANAERKISSSAAVQIYFGIRDLTSAKRVSEMLGNETLSFDDPLKQGQAEVALRQAVGKLMAGADPFETALGLRQTRYETRHLTKQRRLLRTPEEVIATPQDRLYIFADGLSGAIYGERAPYWTRRSMAYRFFPNPYHPPLDHVVIQTRWGARKRPVLARKVPTELEGYPQYADGVLRYIGRTPHGPSYNPIARFSAWRRSHRARGHRDPGCRRSEPRTRPAAPGHASPSGVCGRRA